MACLDCRIDERLNGDGTGMPFGINDGSLMTWAAGHGVSGMKARTEWNNQHTQMWIHQARSMVTENCLCLVAQGIGEERNRVNRT